MIQRIQRRPNMNEQPKIPRRKPFRQASLAKIHLAKKELCLDDDTYRALLERLFGVTSAKDLSDRQMGRLLGEFRRLGWKPKAANPKTAPLRLPQLRKIRLLWYRLVEAGAVRSVEESSLLTFVKRQAGVERMEWLSVAQAGQIIEALKAWGKRVGADVE